MWSQSALGVRQRCGLCRMRGSVAGRSLSKVCYGPKGCLEAIRSADFGKDIFHLIFYILNTDMQFFCNFFICSPYRDKGKYPDLQWSKYVASGTRWSVSHLSSLWGLENPHRHGAHRYKPMGVTETQRGEPYAHPSVSLLQTRCQQKIPPLTSPAPRASEGKKMGLGKVCPSQAYPNPLETIPQGT